MLRPADGIQNAYGDLVFDADEHGHVRRLFIANRPYSAYEKVAWYETTDVNRIWLALCALLLLSLLIAVPLLWWRWLRLAGG